ncbi:chitin-binding, type 1 protein [Tanacetum coccineum]
MKNEVAGVSLGFPANFVPPSSLRKPIDFWCTMKVFKLDANASSVAGVCKGKLGYEHYGSEKVLRLLGVFNMQQFKVIIAFNHFGEQLPQRMPDCRRGYLHFVNDVLTLVSTDMLRRIFNGFGNCLIRAKAYQGELGRLLFISPIVSRADLLSLAGYDPENKKVKSGRRILLELTNAHQNGFYTCNAFITAVNAYNGFGTIGSVDNRKIQPASFFVQTSHETTTFIGFCSALFLQSAMVPLDRVVEPRTIT